MDESKGLQGSGNTRTSGKLYHAAHVEEMEAFDRLPPEMRRMLAQAPGAYSAKEARELLRKYPAFLVQGALLDSCKEEYGVTRDNTALRPPHRCTQRKRQRVVRWRGP